MEWRMAEERSVQRQEGQAGGRGEVEVAAEAVAAEVAVEMEAAEVSRVPLTPRTRRTSRLGAVAYRPPWGRPPPLLILQHPPAPTVQRGYQIRQPVPQP
ncbi:hypothetical protein K0M31_019349 [Melipona bicolor]|uniref:Uncharacterized protein n=1 Tax=Melipona bicolor TaxID=60889 RepID=A0AA40G2R8_9HYME|nr:hypothetical protein K0M31_019349 [Melipona bicolor]